MFSINSLKVKAALLSRERKVEHFYSLCEQGRQILDVGVSREPKKKLSTLNYFLHNFRYSEDSYTGLGVSDLSGMVELFPEKRFIQYQGGKFPFNDRQFDWVFCNAVIEHVGNEDAQLFFVNEMLRVARGVFFTTPNKYFPIESHTNVVFVHWFNPIFDRIKKRYKDNLNLLSYNQLKYLLKKSSASEYQIFRNNLLGLTMTFTVVCKNNS